MVFYLNKYNHGAMGIIDEKSVEITTLIVLIIRNIVGASIKIISYFYKKSITSL